MLKEYLGRWYLVGISSRAMAFRIFGLDRITDLIVREQTFERDSTKDPRKLFEDNIGITYTSEEPQRVVLSFTRLQGKYIKTLPLHPSQVVIKDDREELVVSLRIVPNFEFHQRILMMGPSVKVLEPASLVDEVKAALSEALGRYGVEE